ncbi:reverse transcriptase domain-containing protein [Tanacetum coccineum]
MLTRCEETNLVLNREKCHFMVKEGIVLGHKISKSRIEVDREKVDVIAKLPYLKHIKGVRSFLGHAGFYQRFIKDFSKIARPMAQLLMKDAKFIFLDECIQAFNILKDKLTTAPIIAAPDWNLDFELMCDASDYVVGAVLGQRINKKFRPIYYVSKTMNDAQEHYTTTEKELLTVDRFTLLGTTNTSLWLLNMFQNGWKPRLYRPMTLRTVNGNRKEWADKLDDALWAFRNAYKSPIGSTPFRFVYGKASHLPIKIKHKVYWALSNVNLDLDAARKHRKVKIKMVLSAKKSNLKLSRLIIMWSEYCYRQHLRRNHSCYAAIIKATTGNEVAQETLNGNSSHVNSILIFDFSFPLLYNRDIVQTKWEDGSRIMVTNIH